MISDGDDKSGAAKLFGEDVLVDDVVLDDENVFACDDGWLEFFCLVLW